MKQLLKACLSLALCLCLLLPPALADQPVEKTEKDLPLETILPTAQQQFRSLFDLPQGIEFTFSADLWENVYAYTDDPNNPCERIWAVDFTLVDPDIGENHRPYQDELASFLFYSIQIDSATGEIAQLGPEIEESSQDIFARRLACFVPLMTNAEYQQGRLHAYELAAEALTENAQLTSPEQLLFCNTFVNPRWVSLEPMEPLPMGHTWQVTFYAAEGSMLLSYDVDTETEEVSLPRGTDMALFSQYLLRQGAMEAAKKWAEEKGDPFFWDYQDKAAFFAAFGEVPEGIDQAQATRYDLPSSEDLSSEAALAAAKEAIIRHLQVSPEELDGLPVSLGFTTDFWYEDQECRAWAVHFHHPDSTCQNPACLFSAFVLSPQGQTAIAMRFDLPGEDAQNDLIYYWALSDDYSDQ